MGNSIGRQIINDPDKAIEVMRDASRWMSESGKNPSKWWQLENLNKEFLFNYAKPEEMFVVLENGEPAASIVLEAKPDPEDWVEIDGGTPKSAIYLHWISVARKFAGKGYVKVAIDFAEKTARERGIERLRLDTDAGRPKLRKVYEDLGFKPVVVRDDGYRDTIYYEKKL